ncbi:MAG: hypothetical protein ABIP06_10275 [Pyrinomonadaceae bacterium]
MTNEYLWDKSGNDSEIEKLEKVLQNLRVQNSVPPEISSNVVQFKTTTNYKFPLIRAIAAAFIFGFGLIVFWFYYSNSTQKVVQTFETKDSPTKSILKVENTNVFSEKVDNKIYKNSGETKSEKHFINLKSKSKNSYIISQKLIYKTGFKKAESKNNKQVAKLTAEEKAAYDTLILALSITSSKLKIVSDKVRNTDEKAALNK